jgi:hypothetical protein
VACFIVNPRSYRVIEVKDKNPGAMRLHRERLAADNDGGFADEFSIWEYRHHKQSEFYAAGQVAGKDRIDLASPAA